MKIRNGFVSNSSTSSFVILCKKEDWAKALKSIGQENVKFVHSLFGRGEKTKLYGDEFVFVSLTSCTEDRFSDIGDYGENREDEDDGCDGYEIYEQGEKVIADFMGKIREYGGIAHEGY